MTTQGFRPTQAPRRYRVRFPPGTPLGTIRTVKYLHKPTRSTPVDLTRTRRAPVIQLCPCELSSAIPWSRTIAGN